MMLPTAMRTGGPLVSLTVLFGGWVIEAIQRDALYMYLQ